jgi:hypothetical protein
VDLIQQGQRRLNAFKFDEPLDMGKYRKKWLLIILSEG